MSQTHIQNIHVVCVCVFTYTCKSTRVPEEARGQGQESSSIALHLVYLRQGLSLNVELEMQLDLLTRKSRESSCLCFPARIPGMYPAIHFYFLNMGCEARLGSSCLFCKHVTNRATSQLQDATVNWLFFYEEGQITRTAVVCSGSLDLLHSPGAWVSGACQRGWADFSAKNGNLSLPPTLSSPRH